MVIPVIKFSDKISFVIESMPPKKSAPKPPLKKDAKAEKAEAKKKEAAAKAAKAAAKVAPKVNPAGKKAPAAKPAPPAKPAAGKGGKAKAVAPVIAPAPAPVPAKKDTKRGAKDTGKVVDSGPSKKAKTDADVAKTTAKDDKKDDAVIVKVVTKGGAAVDSLVPNKDNYRVFQEGGKSYSATLNQSNLDGNNNKFYIIQILQNEKTNAIFVWNRWGRVGVPGQNALKGPFLKDGAIREFNSKHHEKTVKGDYIELDIKYDDDGDDKKKDDGKKKVLKTGTSKLDKNVQDLLNLIFDTNIMNNTMKEIGYDAKKMPLGKLGESTIKEAYKVLNSLSGAIKKKDHQQIKSLSGQFYSLIPHDFGFQKMINFILDTEEKVKQKLDMLAAISDMKITTKILENQNSDEDVIDQNYKKLGCKIASVDKNVIVFANSVEGVQGHQRLSPQHQGKLEDRYRRHLQDREGGGREEVQQEGWKQHATLARLEDRQLCGYSVPGAQDCPARSSSVRVSLREGHLLGGYDRQVRPLLQVLGIRQGSVPAC